MVSMNEPAGVESEMEEGEIVDDLDDLSDISSEEEFLLRQRLQVLEKYNNVLGRKKTKANHSSRTGYKRHVPLLDLSEVSGREFEDILKATPNQSITVCHNRKKPRPRTVSENNHPLVMPQQSITVQHTKKARPFKPNEKYEPTFSKREKCHHLRKKDRRKKNQLKIISETSESESDDEYRNKRQKLADAVSVLNKVNNDKSSLQTRLNKMLKHSDSYDTDHIKTINHPIAILHPEVKDASCSPTAPKLTVSKEEWEEAFSISKSKGSNVIIDVEKENEPIVESIELSTDDDTKDNAVAEIEELDKKDTVDSCAKEENKEKNDDADNENGNGKETNSDDDLELLRQYALKTKSSKNVTATAPLETSIEPPKNQSEDEDSDTTELRLICLKSALLKKAIEMKHKQKLKKRLSQSQSIAPDEFVLNDNDLFENIESDNNTDIEAMDMDIGSEGEDKTKDCVGNKITINSEVSQQKDNNTQNAVPIDTVQDNELNINTEKNKAEAKLQNENELDEDEDLLRAKLLTSLTKNLPNLVDPSILNALKASPEKNKLVSKTNMNKPINEQINKTPDRNKAPEMPKMPEKRLIINVGESDSEGENEATKNLKEMHKKLTVQKDFELKLDMFLKSARKEVEKAKSPNDVQPESKTPEKYVAKTVNHLPKSEQMEYKNLVKRMAELEKFKQARQVSMTALKPRNTPMETNSGLPNGLDDQIALSRKNIAEESAKMLKLKEEATKLYQKYKIVATELRNIGTAITLNKREQRTAQNRLAKIRIHHQRLLNSSNSRHSSSNINTNHKIVRPVENMNILKENAKEQTITKVNTLTISVVNELSKEKDRLSVDAVTGSNKKSISVAGSKLDETEVNDETLKKKNAIKSLERNDKDRRKEKDDYESPLQALGGATWEADPHGILCPFEVGGHCKDSACNYLHPKPKLHSLH